MSSTTVAVTNVVDVRPARTHSRGWFSLIGATCALGLALLLCQVASAQVVYDAGSQAQAASVNHAAAGSNRLAIACVSWLDDTATVSGMTSNGAAMTQIGSTSIHPDFHILRSAAFYITAPATSSVPYTAAFSSTPLVSYIQVLSFSGVDQATPIGTPAANASAGDVLAVSTTVSSSATDLVADCLHAARTDATIGANQTERLAASDWGGYGMQARASTEPGNASVDMTWTLASIGKWLQVAIPIKAATSTVAYEWDDDVPYAYVDPAKTASGTGTLTDPYNPTQAMAVTAGTTDRVIVWLPGTLNITGLNPGADKFPYLTPTSSGTSTARIIHKAQYTNSDATLAQRTYINRTENSGTIFGAAWVDYIVWDGFWSSTSAIQGSGNVSGEVSIAGFWLTTGSKLIRCHLDAGDVFFANSNQAVVYFEQASDLELADNYLTNIGGSENYAFGNNPVVMTYNTAAVNFHHNTVIGPGSAGYYAKGQHQDTTPLVAGHRVHHNLFSNLGAGVLVSSPTQSTLSNWVWVYQNVIHDSEWGLAITSYKPAEPYGIAYVNNTVANGATYVNAYGVSHAGLGVIASRDFPGTSFTNGAIEIRNNIFYNFSRMVFQLEELTEDNISWDHNGYHAFTVFRQIGEGGPTSDFEAWQAETPSRDLSGVTADPLFQNAAGNDFRLQSGSAYRNAGTDYLNLLGGGTSTSINLGAYITSDMSDQIGRRN